MKYQIIIGITIIVIILIIVITVLMKKKRSPSPRPPVPTYTPNPSHTPTRTPKPSSCDANKCNTQLYNDIVLDNHNVDSTTLEACNGCKDYRYYSPFSWKNVYAVETLPCGSAVVFTGCPAFEGVSDASSPPKTLNGTYQLISKYNTLSVQYITISDNTGISQYGTGKVTNTWFSVPPKGVFDFTLLTLAPQYVDPISLLTYTWGLSLLNGTTIIYVYINNFPPYTIKIWWPTLGYYNKLD